MTLKNRVAMSPMLMYMAGDDGKVTDRHFVHYGARFLGGVGLVMTEVVAVDPRGRISGHDLGLWSDGQIRGLQRLTAFAHDCGTKIGIQLAHAGRKSASQEIIVGPSALPYGDFPVPHELSTREVQELVVAYRDAAVRAVHAGFDCLEIHAGHGYLLHEFLSPITNQRSDEYGGSATDRAKFALDVITEVRAVWPDDKPLMVRVSAEDCIEGGLTLEDTDDLVKDFISLGVDLIDASSGNIAPGYVGDIFPGYQAKYSRRIRKACGIPTATVGSISTPEVAEMVVSSGSADLVFLGRALLRNPFWALGAAKAAGVELDLPIPTYARATGPYERGF
ncbi:NADH:flavin oxidoreductase/NADH oxidase [Arthrobacter sp. StoSoilB20]|uniref:NADH:flavin oxidoreductase/NADH oxidase n=1 Tax=Arthrobacter sp. StoSoilB20 TaxID=2830995 RepID=UPI0021E13360|nr:NADH:flavin oxidoreductase/NADH oxidase [Arthrobacter sp. StoSoilB20]